MTSIDTIVVPDGAEYQAVCRAIIKADSPITIVPIPLGTKNLEAILQNRGLTLENLGNILIVGLCGSLDANYSPGDVVVYQSCSDLDGDRVSLESELTIKIRDKFPLNLVAGITSDRIIYKVEEKLQLAQTYSVNVVDMEGYDCVKQLQANNQTVAILRVVSDDLSGDIPDLTKAFDRDGKLQPVAMAIAFVKQPLAAWRLVGGSLKGLKILEESIYQLVVSY